VSISSSEIDGEWRTLDALLYDSDEDHGMAFRSKEGDLSFTLHAPNINDKACPIFLKIEDDGDKIIRINK
jgi:hypothetical protein